LYVFLTNISTFVVSSHQAAAAAAAAREGNFVFRIEDIS
jgi:hypothetical protein